MTFMLGAFTSGLASGADNAMKLYKEYDDIKSKRDLKDSLAEAADKSKTSGAPAGAQPGLATPGAVSTDGPFLGGAQSDSAASAPKPDLNADPRKPSNAEKIATIGADALRAYGDGAATMPNPPGTSNPYGSAKSDAAMSAPQPTQAMQTGTPDTMPVPLSAMPTREQAQGSQIFGSSVADWVLGRNPQNRAVHMTPGMGIAMGPGPSSTPMSTSPGGRPPQYLPPQRPAALAGAPQNTPTLANQQNPIGQAIQTQYGNGGM